MGKQFRRLCYFQDFFVILLFIQFVDCNKSLLKSWLEKLPLNFQSTIHFIDIRYCPMPNGRIVLVPFSIFRTKRIPNLGTNTNITSLKRTHKRFSSNSQYFITPLKGVASLEKQLPRNIAMQRVVKYKFLQGYLTQFLKTPTTVILFVTISITININRERCQELNYVIGKQIHNIPITKLILFVGQPWFCGFHPSHPELLEYQNLHKVYHLHHSLFYNSYGAISHGYMYGRYSMILSNKNQLYNCIGWIKQLHKWCGEEVMSLITLAHIHNITIDIKRKTLDKPYSHPHIITKINFLSYNSSVIQELISEFMSYEFGKRVLHYCTDKHFNNGRSYIDYNHWNEAFPTEIWQFVWLLFICFALLKGFGHYNKEKIGLNRKLKVLILTSGLSIGLLYQNSLTSIIAVPDEPKQFGTVKELLQSHYKIAYSSLQHLHQDLAQDFLQSGIDERMLVNSFFQIPRDMLSTDLFRMKVRNHVNGTKIASTSSTSRAKSWAMQLKKATKASNLRCFIVPQQFFMMMIHWKINTENRYWIMQTIQKLHASGLFQIWDDWSTWSFSLEKKMLQEEEHEYAPDYIGTSEVLGMAIFIGVLLGFSGLVFLYEIRKVLLTIGNLICGNGREIQEKISRRFHYVRYKFHCNYCLCHTLELVRSKC
ncbi:unnamed protein product [Orchesella dallaii]|uniref:Uncharacterized protein n=1 Tax=Orchesella dallaii TaxID=48710 RepID=A0ABP1RIV1_9HEXA